LEKAKSNLGGKEGMLKKIDQFFFDEEATISDRLCYYGALTFGALVSIVCLIATI